jgi:hypothetical protein
MNVISNRALGPMLAVFVALSMFSSAAVSLFLLRHTEPGTTASLLFALIPLPFLIASWAAAFFLVRRCDDELQRRIQLEAFAFAYPAIMLLIMTVKLVRRAGFQVPLDFADLFMVMTLVWGLGTIVAWRRYR